jgi:hypothetical protein
VAKTLTIFLAADVSKLNRQLKTAETGIGGFANKIDKLIGPALIGASAAFGAFAVKIAGEAISAASDLAETQNKVGVIFGESSRQILAFAENASTALGQTKQQALDGAATFAQFGKAAGLTGGELFDFSSQLVTLSADLASFSNTTPEQAINALGAALRGEAEPIRQYQVLLDDATLKAEAFELGIYEGTGALTQQQKILAAQSSILKQTTDAQGDFARTSDGLANTQKILTAAVENAKASIGVGLVGAIESATKAMGGSGGIAESIEDSGELLGTFTIGVGVLAGELLELATQLENVGKDADSETQSFEGLARVFIAATGPVGQLGSSLLKLGLYLGTVEQQSQDNYLAAKLLEQGYRDNAAASRELERASFDTAEGLRASYLEFIRYAKAAASTTRTTADQAERLQELDTVTRDYSRSTSGSAIKLKELTDAQEMALEKFEKQKKAVEQLNKGFEDQEKAVQKAKDAISNYVTDLSADLTSGFNLGAGFQVNEGKADVGKWITGVDSEISKFQWYGNVLEAVQREGSVELREYLQAQGLDDAAVWGQALLDNGLVKIMADKLALVQSTAGTLAQSMVPEFLKAGEDSAIETLNGLSTELSKETQRLKKIGQNIGKPIGANIKAEIAEAVAQAIKEAAAARTAALAEISAREAAETARAVEQSTAQSLARLIRNSDNRAGRNVQPVLT